MILFLTSSPCLYQHSPATLNPANGFLNRLRAALPEKPRTLFVCSDPDSFAMTDRFALDMIEAFRDAGLPFGDTAVLDRRNDRHARALVSKAQFLILMGGHVPTQNAYLQELRLKELLADFDGVVMGISAGSMNAASVVYAQPEAEGETDPSFRRFYPGLGLTELHICPHYQQVKDWYLDGKRLYGQITESDSKGRSFYIFPDGTYLYRDGSDHAIYGECLRMTDGITERLSAEGGRIPLK